MDGDPEKIKQDGQAMAIASRQARKYEKSFCLGNPIFTADQCRSTDQRIDGPFEFPNFVFKNHTGLLVH